MTFVEKILPQEIQNEELVHSEFVLLISLWCRVLMFPKYQVRRNVVSAKLPTIVLFRVEKSSEKINCLLAYMSTRWRTEKKRTTGLSKRVVSWECGRGRAWGESCEIVWRNNFPRVQKQHFYEKELSESPDERYLLLNKLKKLQDKSILLLFCCKKSN